MRAWRRGWLAASVVTALCAVVPASAQAATTATLELSGTLIASVSDPGGQVSYALELPGGGTVPLDVHYAQRPRTPSPWTGQVAVPSALATRLGLGSTMVSATGSAGREAMADLVQQGRALRVVSSAPAAGARIAAAPGPSTHKWYVVAPTINGDSAPDADALALADTIANYWKSQSDGEITSVDLPASAADVLHYPTTLATAGDCGLVSDEYLQLRSEALTETGADLDAGDQILLMVPDSQCTNSSQVVGRGDLGSSFASGGFTIINDNSRLSTSTAGHEVGHNYGFMHSGLYACGTVSSACLDEYAGIYDVMGYAIQDFAGLPALNTPYRLMTGIDDPGEIDTPNTSSTAPQTETINPRSSTSGVRSLHLVDPATGRDLWLDYRSGTGQDSTAAYAADVLLPVGAGLVDYSPGVVIETELADDRTAVIPAKVGDAHTDGQAALGQGDTWTNSDGSLTISVDSITAGTSADVTIQYSGVALVPGTPSISGTARVGSRLTGNTGTWLHATTLTRQWLVGGKAVPGATGSTFTPRATDRGKVVIFRVTGTRGSTHTVRDAATKPVAAGTLTSTTPKIKGKAKVGRKLTAVAGSWTAGTSRTYRWYANGKAIKHATKAKLKLTKRLKGKEIVVKVTGRKSGYTTVVRASKATKKVRR